LKETQENYRGKIRSSRSLVIKVGSQVMLDANERIDRGFFEDLAATVSGLVKQGRKVTIVSSGAIVNGLLQLPGLKKPLTMPEKQAVAGLGQPILIQHYQRAFARHKIPVGQVLLTHEDFSVRARYLNSKNTLEEMHRLGIVPVINENDTVAVDEIRFGENDQLAALVAVMLKADLLVILSTVPGFCSDDPLTNPSAQVIPVIRSLDRKLFECVGEGRSKSGSGGMKSKLKAAGVASAAGIPTFIGSGRDPEVLRRLLDGKIMGSLVLPGARKLKGLKHWLLFAGRPRGELKIDPGAVRALVERNKSLLPSGLTEVSGKFLAGDLVAVTDEQGQEVAKGLCNFSSEDLKKIMGRHTDQIEKILGAKDYDEVIHRDNLVLSDRGPA
jgi:glutamate 5-kinase